MAEFQNSGSYPAQLFDIYPVPPLARRNDARRSLNIPENDKIFRFLQHNRISRFIYGGNAFLYQITLADYSELIDWLGGLVTDAVIIPAVGPSYGRAIDQAPMIRKCRFPSVLVLPTADPRDAQGLETGMREIAEACGVPLCLYVKDESNFGADKEAGMDVIGRLVDAKVCVSIKYAIVRKDPSDDSYLTGLLKRVPASRVISGIGERPAVVHLRDFNLCGFTTGSGALAPKLSRAILNACSEGDFAKADEIRSLFLPLEDLRDAWGPPRVLHSAVELAGLAQTGRILPFVSPLPPTQINQLRPIAQDLFQRNKTYEPA